MVSRGVDMVISRRGTAPQTGQVISYPTGYDMRVLRYRVHALCVYLLAE